MTEAWDRIQRVTMGNYNYLFELRHCVCTAITALSKGLRCTPKTGHSLKHSNYVVDTYFRFFTTFHGIFCPLFQCK